MTNPLNKVVEIKGGQVALAEAIKLKQGHIWSWLNKTKFGVPAEYVIAVSDSVNWEVTPHQLRPDLYPHPDDGLPDHLRNAA
jgi:DNA-binding transcriptional regulator YdaS (Cro superfamily)